MRAVVLKKPFEIAIEEVEKPSITEPTDVLLRVEMSAICGTDLHPYEGRIELEPDIILGHEFLGVVEEVGSAVSQFEPGDRAVASFMVNCGSCWACHKGDPARCAGMRMFGMGMTFGGLGGGQAEYIVVPNADLALRHLPEGSSATDEDLLFVGDIMTTAYESVRRTFVPGDVVAIVGAGPVGMCSAMAAQALGASNVIVIDKVQARLDQVAAMGAVAVNADTDSPADAVFDLTDWRGADVVIDAVGHESALLTACSLARPGGAISIPGVYNEDSLELPFGDLWLKGIRIQGGVANITTYMDEVIALINAGKLRPSDVISHRMPLSEAEKAYDLFHHREATKVVLDPRS